MVRRFKMVLAIIFLNCLIVLTDNAMAGSGAHGGNAIRCLKNSIETYETLDHFEGRVYRHLTFDMGDQNANPKDQVAVVLNRLVRLDPERAHKYEILLNSFESEMSPLIDTTLTPINDWGYLPIPQSCEVNQVIWQVEPKFGGDTVYWVDMKQWNKLSKRDQALLMLHEIVYRDAIARGQIESSRARFICEMIASSKIANMSQAQYEKMISETGFDRYSFEYIDDGTKYVLNYYAKGQMERRQAVEFCKSKGMAIPFCNLNLQDRTDPYLNRSPNELMSSKLVRFIKSAEFSGTNKFWGKIFPDIGNATLFSFVDSVTWTLPDPDSVAEVICVGHVRN